MKCSYKHCAEETQHLEKYGMTSTQYKIEKCTKCGKPFCGIHIFVALYDKGKFKKHPPICVTCIR